MIRKVLFLIGNKHFLIRKCHFGIGGGSYVAAWSVLQCTPFTLFFQEYSNDPPPSHHHRRRRFRHPGRLLGYDCSEERHLPGN